MDKKVIKPSKVLLIVRDGWGYSPDKKYNMIAQANTPYTDYLEKTYPTTLLKASGLEVGLPDGYMGNSEVGHMTIGAGRVLEQSLLRINNSIKDTSFFKNKVFLKAIDVVKKRKSNLHIIGLLQKEGVHSHFNHLIAILEMAKKEGLCEQVYLHIITDGRDSGIQNSLNYIRDLNKEIKRIGIGKIVTLSGRYFAMDRNNNWNRVEEYYNLIFFGNKKIIEKERQFLSPEEYIIIKYKNNDFSDEFLKPAVFKKYSGFNENDVVININFRKDRQKQLTKVFCEKNFCKFKVFHKNIFYVSMTSYYSGLDNVAFPDISVDNILGKVLEMNKKTQLRISETEKYAHVTFFFDGGKEYDFNGEKKIIIPSPNVNTYDLKPEMSSKEITKHLIYEIKNTGQDFILCNFPNADMVGHTGNYNAIKKGIEAIDISLKKIIPVALKHNYVVMVTADHGNAEYKHNSFMTSHTMNPVPFIFISNASIYNDIVLINNLGLKNIYATVLNILGIKNIYKNISKSIF